MVMRDRPDLDQVMRIRANETGIRKIRPTEVREFARINRIILSINPAPFTPGPR